MKRLWILLVITVGLSGCATPFRKGLPDEHRESLSQARVVANLSDSELVAQYPTQHTSAVGVGPIGSIAVGLVDAYMNLDSQDTEEAAIIKLKQAMKPELLSEIYRTQYAQLADAVPELKGRPVQVWTEYPSEGIASLGLQTGDISLLLKPTYSLTVSKRRLQVLLSVYVQEVIATHSNRPPEMKTLYRNIFMFQSKPIPAVDRNWTAEAMAAFKAQINEEFEAKLNETNAGPQRDLLRAQRDAKLESVSGPMPYSLFQARQSAVWLERSDDELQQTIEQGVSEVLEMLALDIKAKVPRADMEEKKVLRSVNGREWIRLSEPGNQGVIVSLSEGDSVEYPPTNQVSIYIGV